MFARCCLELWTLGRVIILSYHMEMLGAVLIVTKVTCILNICYFLYGGKLFSCGPRNKCSPLILIWIQEMYNWFFNTGRLDTWGIFQIITSESWEHKWLLMYLGKTPCHCSQKTCIRKIYFIVHNVKSTEYWQVKNPRFAIHFGVKDLKWQWSWFWTLVEVYILWLEETTEPHISTLWWIILQLWMIWTTVMLLALVMLRTRIKLGNAEKRLSFSTSSVLSGELSHNGVFSQ